MTWARFLCLAWSKLRLGLANHRTGYFSNLACDWLSIVWAYSEHDTENGPWFTRWGSLGLYSLSDKASYRQISWSLEAARLDVIMIVSLWNLTGILAALLPTCLSNFRAIRKVYTLISCLRDFTRSCGKTSGLVVNGGQLGIMWEVLV